MPSYSKNDIILVRYPFSDLSGAKIRPAVVISAKHVSQDLFVTPLTSKTASLLEGEFILSERSMVGLNVVTAIKRGVYTVHDRLIVKQLGKLDDDDAAQLAKSLQGWLDL
ncbi:MAG: type II toxin-antitoxin system PemK/MazF family toxin [Alkalinema sp. RU_4_3]|nr:type II toxin-antitoxin system PemK/MazF family toxin [Alkalinema sp. RU_4_3]